MVAAMKSAQAHQTDLKQRESMAHIHIRRWPVPSASGMKSLRMRLNLTQTEFARRYGLEVELLRSYEQGRRAPSQTMALVLAMIAVDPKAFEGLVNKADKRQRS